MTNPYISKLAQIRREGFSKIARSPAVKDALRGAGQGMLRGAPVGAGVGGAVGAVQAPEGERLQGAARGAGAGAALGAAGGGALGGLAGRAAGKELARATPEQLKQMGFNPAQIKDIVASPTARTVGGQQAINKAISQSARGRVGTLGPAATGGAGGAASGKGEGEGLPPQSEEQIPQELLEATLYQDMGQYYDPYQEYYDPYYSQYGGGYYY